MHVRLQAGAVDQAIDKARDAVAALDEVPPNGKDPLARLKSAVAKIRQALDPTEVGLHMNQLTGTARQIAIEALEARPCGRP